MAAPAKLQAHDPNRDSLSISPLPGGEGVGGGGAGAKPRVHAGGSTPPQSCDFRPPPPGGGLLRGARCDAVISEIAYAKINLALHVRSRRSDGYHDLETLFAFVDAGDVLTAHRADAFALTLTGPFAGDLAGESDNLVLRAATALARGCGVTSALAFTLDKRLPVASGIGGGSADAGAAIRLAKQIWDCEVGGINLTELGADVPACVASRTCFGSGVGDQLVDVDLPGLAGTPVLLVNPRVSCPTGPVFRAWDGVDCGALDPSYWRDARNDLETPAIALVPEIGAVLSALRQSGAQVMRMSGSGATCYALYDDTSGRDAAARQIAERHPNWWTLSGALR